MTKEEQYREELKRLEDEYNYLAHEAGEFSNSGRRWVYLQELDTIRKQIMDLKARLNLQENEDEDQFGSGDNPKQR